MALSRREFVRALARSGAATAVAAPLIIARGHEALGELWASAAPDASTIHLASNENPNGPGVRALDAIRGALPLANRYPYGEADRLVAAIARQVGVDADGIVLGCGSAEILRMAMQAFTSPAKPLVTSAPTFETPTTYAASFGVPVRSVPVDASLNLDLATLETRAQGAGLVYLCNPNNPTATIVPPAAISGLAGRLALASPQTVLLIDEAYHEYVEDPAYQTSIPLTPARGNIIVSRTFSKLYGMAGLRCGYGVAHTDTLARMRPFKLETGVNQFALAAATVAIDDRDHIERERRLNREARAYTRRLFESLGYVVAPSDTNFILVDLRRDARSFRDGCRRAGVLVGRAFPPLTTYARISIGTMDEMVRAGETFRRVLSSRQSTGISRQS